MAYEGSCHCGAVTFSVEGDAPAKAMVCNCSMCRRTGVMLAFGPRSSMTIRGKDALREYHFHTHKIAHQFCTTCGIEPFAVGTAPDGTRTVAINLRCVPAIDLDALEIQHFDGASR
ncbi:GFA family protein [Roseomonas terrae]|uniref:GFA family protein n=1 Tax=Neoroseomonas terrae TaxID=424799 RepID=A0ABS5ECU8_9PROT|nr:GFA family protein [Neoroseomonas terrae]MBR0648836.1 GFA family protein [Neoroseomonas terrae]